MRRTAITLLSAAMVLTMAPAAFAQTEEPPCDVYSGICPEVGGTTVQTGGPEVPTQVEGTKTVRGGPTSGSTLPMTGAELSGLVLAGVVLVGGGTTLVVASRRRKQHPSN